MEQLGSSKLTLNAYRGMTIRQQQALVGKRYLVKQVDGTMEVLVVAGLFLEPPLPLAVIGHEGGTFLVVLNGLRLLLDPIRVI